MCTTASVRFRSAREHRPLDDACWKESAACRSCTRVTELHVLGLHVPALRALARTRPVPEGLVGASTGPRYTECAQHPMATFRGHARRARAMAWMGDTIEIREQLYRSRFGRNALASRMKLQTAGSLVHPSAGSHWAGRGTIRLRARGKVAHVSGHPAALGVGSVVACRFDRVSGKCPGTPGGFCF